MHKDLCTTVINNTVVNSPTYITITYCIDYISVWKFSFHSNKRFYNLYVSPELFS